MRISSEVSMGLPGLCFGPLYKMLEPHQGLNSRLLNWLTECKIKVMDQAEGGDPVLVMSTIVISNNRELF